ncbi:hypothetical protein V5O48_002742 [Marasmius crinis-equi]|uniref:Uncharacterized protein n=1 Tax=Marasmius crinis-equi TaxID=585013 RepID=A0ABR3FUR0_9AGAR
MISTATAPIAVKTNVGRYVPVHKRRSSIGSENGNWRARDSGSDSSSSSVSSSPPSSPMKTAFPAAFTFHGHHGSSGTVSPQPVAPALPIYSINELLLLQKSPFARMSQETRDAIKENLPEIVLSRKQRHTLKGKMHGRIPHGGPGYARPPQVPQVQQRHDAPAIERVPMVHAVSPSPVPTPTTPPTAAKRQPNRVRMARRGTKSFVDELSVWRMVQRSPVVAQ